MSIATSLAIVPVAGYPATKEFRAQITVYSGSRTLKVIESPLPGTSIEADAQEAKRMNAEIQSLIWVIEQEVKSGE